MKKIRIKLHWQIFIALVLGVFFGLYLKEHVHWIEWIGEVFLRGLKMIIIPIILTSIISAITNIGSAGNIGRLGLKTIIYYITTSIIAILTGLILVNLIRPGTGADLGLINNIEGLVLVEKSLGQTFIEMIPVNIFKAIVEGKMLSIILFAFLFGFVITQINNKHKEMLTDFFNASFEAMMKLTMIIIKLAPLGIFGIIAGVVAQTENPAALAFSMGEYMITVIAGLSIHCLITLPLIQLFLAKVNPLKHFQAVSTPLLTAFSTSSTMATLPLTLEAVEHNDGVSRKITGFTLPLGATVNMDGTALYECVAAVFIAQAYGLDLSLIQQALVVITALLASIGAAGVPMAGMVMITIILSAIGLPLEAIGLIISVDRILDMFRTATNVWSDTTGALVVARTEGEAFNVSVRREVSSM
jgi:Na+/H+-dicarboxylate symporter